MPESVTSLVFLDSTGWNYADYPTFLAWYQQQYQNIYGQDVYLGPDSQDGQFVAIVAQSAYDFATAGAAIYNSFAPNSAQGAGLARLVQINGLKKEAATNSTVDLVIGGTAYTLLTNCVAIDVLQQQWSIPSTTIPSGGTITVTATAVTIGAIQALPSTITGIFTPTNGWQTVTNPSAATPGVPVETDAELRVRQAVSTANPSLTVLEGTLGAVLNVPGVVEGVAYENPTNTTDGNGLPPHSFSIVASGGIDADVAAAIQVHKTPGTQTYGSTTVVVNDSHGMPIPINFYRPTATTINVQVTITPNGNYVSGYAALIQAALAAAVTYPNITIGGLIVITQLYVSGYLVGTVAGQSYTIVSIEISTNLNPVSTSNIQLAFNEIPVCDASTNVTVVT